LQEEEVTSDESEEGASYLFEPQPPKTPRKQQGVKRRRRRDVDELDILRQRKVDRRLWQKDEERAGDPRPPPEPTETDFW
jgi:hypothetical protein